MNKHYLKVKESPNLIRDSETKAIINNDDKAYLEYLNKKNMQKIILEQQNSINNLNDRLNEITQLLTILTKDKR